MRQAYISKHNKTRNIHANLLMITDGTGNWHYLAIKSISGLLRGITSNHNGETIIVQIVFARIQRKRNLESMKMFVKTMIFVI